MFSGLTVRGWTLVAPSGAVWEPDPPAAPGDRQQPNGPPPRVGAQGEKKKK